MIRTALSILVALAVTTAQARPLWLVDFVYVSEGHSLADHDAFLDNAAHIAARHGTRPLITLDRVPGYAHPGPIAPDRIVLWSLPDQAALAAWENDADRVWFEDLAGHILAGQSSRYLAREQAMAPIGPEGIYLVDIPRIRAGADPAEVAAYADGLARAGRPHGLDVVATFGEIAHLSGPFGRIDGLRLLHLPDRAALDALLADPDWRRVEAGRNDVYDFVGAARQLYRAAVPFQP